MFEKNRNTRPEAAKPQPQQDNYAASSSTPASSGKMAVIGPGIHINGDISGDENLQIDGTVDGKVSLGNHDLTVGDTGTVTANLTAKTIKIHGKVTGDIQGSEMVVVSKTGKVLGNIVAPRVTLEDGAQFKGSIDMSPDTDSVNGAVNAKPPKAVGADSADKESPVDQQATSAA